jgi:cytochrome P450
VNLNRLFGHVRVPRCGERAEIRIVDLDAKEPIMLKTKLVFDPYSEDFFTDPFDTYRRMRDEAPVYYNETYDFYALSRHDDVAAALKDFRTYSSAGGTDLEMIRSAEKPPVPSVIFMDPPEHRRMRSLVNKVITPRAIQSQRELVAEQIVDPCRVTGALADLCWTIHGREPLIGGPRYRSGSSEFA